MDVVDKKEFWATVTILGLAWGLFFLCLMALPGCSFEPRIEVPVGPVTVDVIIPLDSGVGACAACIDKCSSPDSDIEAYHCVWGCEPVCAGARGQ